MVLGWLEEYAAPTIPITQIFCWQSSVRFVESPAKWISSWARRV